MNFKKSTTLNGILMHPLLIGGRALIYHCGQVIRTSPIVAIHDASAYQIRFETMNNNYTLLMNPTPQTAVNSYMTSLAA